jgi:hypothetical protein
VSLPWATKLSHIWGDFLIKIVFRKKCSPFCRRILIGFAGWTCDSNRTRPDRLTISQPVPALVRQYLIKRHSGKHIDVSRLFIYYNGQIIDQKRRRVRDYGVPQEAVASGLRKYGVYEEDLWSYKVMGIYLCQISVQDILNESFHIQLF